MNGWDIIWIAAGGSLGAIARYEIGRRMGRRFVSPLPYGTLLVNLLGSFLLGLLIAWRAPLPVYQLAGTGFMGAFTTFSTFSFELAERFKRGQWAVSLLYVAVSLTGGLLLAWAGLRFHS